MIYPVLSNGLTLPVLLSDLETALTQKYSYLQRVLKDARMAGLLECKLNQTKARLIEIAREVITHIQCAIREALEKEDAKWLDEENLANEQFEQGIAQSPSARRWAFWKKDTTDLVFIRVLKFKEGKTYYLCYGSDAIKVLRYTDRLPTPHSNGPLVAIPEHRIYFYKDLLTSKGIQTLLIH